MPRTGSISAAIAILATAGPHAAARSMAPASMTKVIQMLTDMEATGKKKINEEQVAFAKFDKWCSMEAAELKTDIGKGQDEISRLESEIGKLASEISGHSDSVHEHSSNKASYESDFKKAKDQRARDHAEFLEAEKDFSESVDAIDRALVILSQQDYNRPGGNAFLQVTTDSSMPAKARALVQAFSGLLQKSDGDGTGFDVPTAHAYEFQSGGVIELLKKLQDEFRQKLSDTQKDEMNSKHAHDMIAQDLTDAAENAQEDIEVQSNALNTKTVKKAKSSNQLQSVTATKASDEKTHAEVSQECSEKKMSFREKQNLRKEELEALAKAREILSSDRMNDISDKQLGLVQSAKVAVLLQAAQASNQGGVHRKIRDFLENEGRRLHSQRLTLLAGEILADPFSKVKKLISSMVTRLMEEANADAKHEGFCDTEMGKSKITREKLTKELDALVAAMEDGKATIYQLSESTAEISKEVSGLQQAMLEASKLRSEEKERNKFTVQDAKDAQQAVSQATAVLKDFYAKAGTATGFLQVDAAPNREYGLKSRVQFGSDEWNALANPSFEGKVDTGHKEGMQTFGEKETGQQDEAQYGVVSLLEVILADFASVEAETTAAEETASNSHSRFMADSQQSKAVKEKKIEMNSADKTEAESKLQTDTADWKATERQLLAATRYFDKLKPQCIDQGMTWDERVAARQAEIDSLKQALQILGNPDVA